MKNIKLSMLVILFILYSCSFDKTGFEFENFNNTPLAELAVAVKNNDPISVKNIIVNNKIEIDFKEPIHQFNLLTLAIVNKKDKAFLELLENGANPNLVVGRNNDTSPLNLAISYQSNCELFYVNKLLEFGADPNIEIVLDDDKFFAENYPIYVAVLKGYTGDECLDIIKTLVDYGADYSKCSPKPLVEGICEGVVQLSLEGYCMEFLRYFIVDRKMEIPEVVYVKGSIDKKGMQLFGLEEILMTDRFSFKNYPESRKVRDEILVYLKNR